MTEVLIIGDSISVGYTPYAATSLAGEFAVTHSEGNAGDSANLLARLDDYLAAASDAAVIHFNCGLHDLRRTGEAYQVAPGAYRDNLLRIVERLGRTGAKLIWAQTTPVHDQRHAATHTDWGRWQADVDAYNAVAGEVVEAAGIAVNPLDVVVIDRGKDWCIRDDGVHMTEGAYELLGEAVAEAIRDVCG